jgi:hypothetical protein
MSNFNKIFVGSISVDLMTVGRTIVNSAFYGSQKVWTAFTPPEIPGIRLWLDASVGLYDSEIGGNPVINGGEVVARWEDLSGNSFNAIGSSGPQLRLNQVNGRPSLFFGGSSFLQIPSILNGTSASAFVVVRPTSTISDSGALIGNIGPSNSYYPYRAGNIFDDFATTVRKDNIPQPARFYNWHLYNVRSAANNWQYIFNGGLHFSTTSNTYRSGPNPPGPFIGKSTTGTTSIFVGEIAEIAVYNSSLSNSQIDTLSEYFGVKYNLF